METLNIREERRISRRRGLDRDVPLLTLLFGGDEYRSFLQNLKNDVAKPFIAGARLVLVQCPSVVVMVRAIGHRCSPRSWSILKFDPWRCHVGRCPRRRGQ